MARINKFEQLLEYVVNGEQNKAEELFHALVVAKSREIYENLITQESDDDDSDDAESDNDSDDDNMDEAFGDDNDNDESDDFMGDVEADDDEGDDEMGADDMGDMDDMGDEGSSSEISDLRDELEELKAEFKKLVHGEEAEEHDHPGIHDMGGDDMGMDSMGGDDMGMDEPEDEGYGMFEEEVEEINMSPAELMREYVDKIGEPYKSGNGISNTKEGNHVGAQAGSVTGTTNTRSIVAKKNDMGGTTANIARGGDGGKGGTQGGLLNPTTKEENFGNINVPGGKAGKTGFTHKVSDGHGTEKKGKGEAGGTNTKSLFR